ncbi:hypothetical protein NEAUS06_0992 [Nematocida ausubeli]|nr:hypothetical protein NEAUS06_0992 [Nematocida ausubeli]
MHGSQYIRQISIKLKQYLKQCEESGNFAPSAAKKTVLDCLVPLSEIVLKSPASSHAAQPSDVIPVESPYIYALIAEYLCSQNAVDSARILLEEIDEMLPVKSTHETVCIPTVYLPWAEELNAVAPRLITKKSLSYTQMTDIKKKCQRIINSHKEAEAPADPVTKLYGIIESALKEMDKWNNCAEQRKDVFQRAIIEIKECFFEENETLVYFDGHIGHVYSKYTAQYEEIKQVLGLFVIPTRHNEVKQLVHAKRACFPKSGITLETFYHIGKKMEEMNITPYDTEVEVESAVPPILSFHSTFFCPVLRSECSFDNMPCVLTCGHIISVKAVEKIASFKGVIFKCPYCPKDVNVKDVFKIKMTI